jgi:hypothetical protein
MEIIIKLTQKELLEILGPEFAVKLSEKISDGSISIISDVSDQTVESEEPLSEDDKKMVFVDDMSWIAFYIYDLIRYEHSDETGEFFIMKEADIKEKQDHNFGMIVGGCTQISNRHNMPPFLKIIKPSRTKRLIGANKYYLDAVETYKQENFTDYESEMKARKIQIPHSMKR